MSREFVEALSKLRAISVAARRERVAECLRFDSVCGNDRRLIEVQDVIAAIDAAMVDEYRLLQPEQPAVASQRSAAEPLHTVRSEPVSREQDGAGQDPGLTDSRSSPAESAWRSYRDWLGSSGKRLAS